MRVGELPVGQPGIVVELVLDATEARAVEVVDVGAVADPGHAVARRLHAHAHEDEVVDPGVEVGDLQAQAVVAEPEVLLQHVEADFPGLRALRTEERVGVHVFRAAAVGAAGDQALGHRRRAPALAVGGEQLQPVDAGLDRQAEGRREAPLLAVDGVLQRHVGLPGGAKDEGARVEAGVAAQAVAVVTQPGVEVEPVVVVVVETGEQATEGAVALGGHAFGRREADRRGARPRLAGVRPHLVVEELQAIVGAQRGEIVESEGRGVLRLRAVGVGLVGDRVAGGDTALQGLLAVAVVDVVELGLEVHQRVVRRVAVVDGEVLRTHVAAAELFPERLVLGVEHVGVVVGHLGGQVAELQALVLRQGDAKLGQTRAHHIA